MLKVNYRATNKDKIKSNTKQKYKNFYKKRFLKKSKLNKKKIYYKRILNKYKKFLLYIIKSNLYLSKYVKLKINLKVLNLKKSSKLKKNLKIDENIKK